MTLSLEAHNTIPLEDTPDGFAELDAYYASLRLSPEDAQRFGRYAITDTTILDVPERLQALGRTQTNPSQVERIHGVVNGEVEELLYVKVREEDALLHIGTTISTPQLLRVNEAGVPRIVEFPDGMVLTGEDPRVTRGVKLPRNLRSKQPFSGWLESVIEATPRPGNPDEAISIKQVFYWGETLSSLEPIAEIHDSKNTTIVPRLAEDDCTVDEITRPKPYMAHLTLPNVLHTTDERIYAADNIINKASTPDGVHTGPNNGVPGDGYIELSTHEAQDTWLSDGGRLLNYRLSQAVFELPTRDFPKGRFVPLGVLAVRGQFPYAAPKPRDRHAASYYNILYGSRGLTEWMLSGVGDNRIGAARVIRVH